MQLIQLNPLLLLLLIFVPIVVCSQQKTNQSTWHVTVADSSTVKGIDKATVAINKTYYVTAVNGEVNINRKIIHSKDCIRVSCIGYKTKIFFVIANNIYPDTIKLASETVALNEVKISPSGSMGITEGDIKKKYNTHRVTSPGSSYAQFIPNYKKITGTISSVEYVVNDELDGIEKPFRVRLFTKMKDSLSLDKELTKDTIIVYNPQKKKRLIVDVSQYSIRVPQEGVIAVFELLDSSYYSKDVIWHDGFRFIKTPGIEMDQVKNNYLPDYTKADRKTPYAMVGPTSDTWNWNDSRSQWYVYAEGNNFAITITIDPDK